MWRARVGAPVAGEDGGAHLDRRRPPGDRRRAETDASSINWPAPAAPHAGNSSRDQPLDGCGSHLSVAPAIRLRHRAAVTIFGIRPGSIPLPTARAQSWKAVSGRRHRLLELEPQRRERGFPACSLEKAHSTTGQSAGRPADLTPMAWLNPAPRKRASEALRNLAEDAGNDCRRGKLDWHEDTLAEVSAIGGHFNGTRFIVNWAAAA
jgi:hypothetical protein